MKITSISTAAWLLAGWAASVSCSDNANHSQPRADAAAVSDSGNAGADASSTATHDAAPAGSDAAMRTDAATAAGDAAVPADATTAPVDASMDGSTAGAKKWWEAATWTRLSWLPSACVVAVLDDPSQIPPLQWEPLALANLMGATPVAPAGWTYYNYQELADGSSRISGTVSSERIVEVRDKAGASVFAYKSNCVEDDLASTSRGVCVHFGFRNDDRGAVACGDLRNPKPMLEIPRFGFVYASSDELIMIKTDRDDRRVFIVDVSNASVHDTKLTASFKRAAAHDHDAFTIQLTSAPPNRGIIYNWDGATGYKMIRDPAPLGVINVHAAAGQLVWTETEVDGLRTGTSIYRAPWPPSGAMLNAALVYKTNVSAIYDESALAAGQLAIKGSDRIELITLDDAKRRTVSVGSRWNVSSIYLNDRSLVITLVDRASASKYVSFRANLSDVLALPADL